MTLEGRKTETPSVLLGGSVELFIPTLLKYLEYRQAE